MSKQAICLICLRSDSVVELRKVDEKYSNFHDELCDFMLDMDATYCWYCEHQLKKAYRFRKMCRNTLKVMKSQKKMKACDRTALNNLYKLVPRVPVSLWSKKSYAEFIFEEVEQPKPINNVIITLDGKIIDAKITVSQINVINEPNEIINSKIVTDNVAIPTIIETASSSNNVISQHSSMFHNIKDGVTPKIKDVCTLANDEKQKHYVEVTNNKTHDSIGLDDFAVSDNECNNIKQEYEEVMSEQGDIDVELRNYVLIKMEREKQQETVTYEMTEEVSNNLERSKNEKLNSDDDIESSNELSGPITDKVDIDNASDANSLSSDQSITLINYKDLLKSSDVEKPKVLKGIRKRKNTQQINRQKIISVLEEKFAMWGEIKGRDGAIFDKNQILDAIENKLKWGQIKILWPRIKASNHNPSDKVMEMFESIHNQFYKHDYNSMFDIEYLNTDEKKREEFDRRKTYNYYLKAEYKCELCYTRLASKKFLALHIRKYHSESSGKLTCKICPQRFKSKPLLTAHMLFWHDVVYKCKECDAVLYMRNQWMSHYNNHKGIVHTCTKCKKKFKQAAPACRHCARVVSGAGALARHVNTQHTSQIGVEIVGSEDAKCNECNIIFVSKEVYEKHWAISHLKEPTEDLDVPAVKQRNRIVRKQFNRSKVKGRRRLTEVPCKLCHKKGYHLTWLKTHYQLEHPEANVDVEYADRRPYLCDVCGNGYSSKYGLMDHIEKSHSTETRFECEICSQKFTSRSFYINHKKKHEGNNKETYSCSECGNTFTNKGNLQRHSRIHGGDRIFKCRMCPKDFLYQDSLKWHVMTVHCRIRKQRIRKRANVPRRAPKRARVATESDSE